MSNDRKDAELPAEISKIEGKPSQSTYEQLRNMNEYILNGVRFLKRSNRGPITVHSTGSLESDRRSKKLIPLEESKAIAEHYLASLIAGAKAAQSEASSSSPTSNKLMTPELEKAIADRCIDIRNSVSVVTTDDQKVIPQEPGYLKELRKQTLRD